jgi:hypothetical protein
MNTVSYRVNYYANGELVDFDVFEIEELTQAEIDAANERRIRTQNEWDESAAQRAVDDANCPF